MTTLYSRKQFIAFVLLLSGAAVLCGQETAWARNGARLQIQSTVDEMLAILQDERLGRPENRRTKKQLISAVIRHRFDFEEMTKRILARDWKKRTEEERQHFVSIFSRLLENTYLKRLEAYSGQKVLVLEETVRQNKSIVPTLIRKNDLEVPINYKLMAKGDLWVVYDVVIEGVSLVRNYRTQFRNILKKEQYAGLVRRVEEKLLQMESEEE